MHRLGMAATPELASDVVEAIREDGVVVVDGFLSADQLGRLNAELDPLLLRASPDHGKSFLNDSLATFFGTSTRHALGLPGKSKEFTSEVLAHPVLLGVADAFLLPNCARYQLNLAHVIDRGPGAEMQWPHRDDEGWSAYMNEEYPELQVASVVALTDFTAANGATLIAEGSHRWKRGRKATDTEMVPVQMPAGSAVIYLGSTIHAGGANTTTNQWRRGMQVSYVLGWLRTEENHYLTTPVGTVRSMPVKCQELLGYATHDGQDREAGALGHVDLREPVDLIAEGIL